MSVLYEQEYHEVIKWLMLNLLEKVIGFRVNNPVEPDIGRILKEQGLVRGKVLLIGIEF